MKRVLWSVAAALLAVSLVLGIVAMHVAWGEADAGGSQAEYHVTHFSSEFFGGATIDISYGEDALDDQDGVGLMRAAGPLWVLGMVFIGIALLAIQDLLLVRAAWMGWAAVVAAAIGTVLLVTGLVLLPIGIDQNLDFDRANDPEDTSGSVDWKAGLVLGSIAGGLAVAGLALTVVAAAPRLRAHAGEAGFD